MDFLLIIRPTVQENYFSGLWRYERSECLLVSAVSNTVLAVSLLNRLAVIQLNRSINVTEKTQPHKESVKHKNMKKHKNM